jgi:hypothetical protein
LLGRPTLRTPLALAVSQAEDLLPDKDLDGELLVMLRPT